MWVFGPPLPLPPPSPPGWPLLTLLTPKSDPTLAPERPHLLADDLVTWKDSAVASVKACHRRGGLNSRRVLSPFWKLHVQHQGVLTGSGEGLLFGWEMAAFPPRPHMASSLWGQRQPGRHQSYLMGAYPCDLIWALSLEARASRRNLGERNSIHDPQCRPQALCRAAVSPPASRPASISIILSFQEDYLRAAIHLWAGSLLPGQFSEGEEITAWVAAGFPYC